MPSPFPGMDPYLENPSFWADFHSTFLIRIRADLNRILPQPYVARFDRYDYYILVCPGVDCPSVGIWPLSIRDRFPLVPVPLRSAEQPVLLALKPCLDEAYDEAQFSREIDYNQPPPVPFSDQDAAWVKEILGPIKG